MRPETVACHHRCDCSRSCAKEENVEVCGEDEAIYENECYARCIIKVWRNPFVNMLLEEINNAMFLFPQDQKVFKEFWKTAVPGECAGKSKGMVSNQPGSSLVISLLIILTCVFSN